MQRLPPLNALRVFECAARHLSFTRAAEELCVTQAAVSQQVRSLEEHLGLQLFRRLNRALLLTDAGQRYAIAIRQALATIAEATAALAPPPMEGGTLTVSCMPSFAHKWLMPRLGRFLDREPGISLRVHAGSEVVDFRDDGIHCAVRLGPGRYDGVFTEFLFTEYLTPVCAPAVAERLRTPEDLLAERLLHDWGVEWAPWFAAAGLAGREVPRGPEFYDTSMALQAAVDGRGVVIGRTAMIHEDLATGRLVKPFDLQVPHDYSHWFVCPEGHQDHPNIRALRAWLLEESAPFRDSGPPPAQGRPVPGPFA